MPTKGIVYYTDNQLDDRLMRICQNQIEQSCVSSKIDNVVCVSLKPLNWGTNVVLPLERGPLTMFKQILAGLEVSTADVVFYCEHDVLYHPSHFVFVPTDKEIFYYNMNVWKVDIKSGHALYHSYCGQTSGLCAYREKLLQHYRERVEMVERIGYSRRMGYEPGTHNRIEWAGRYNWDKWKSEFPNVDICHGQNLTPARWRKDQYRDKRNLIEWIESENWQIPGWDNLKVILGMD